MIDTRFWTPFPTIIFVLLALTAVTAAADDDITAECASFSKMVTFRAASTGDLKVAAAVQTLMETGFIDQVYDAAHEVFSQKQLETKKLAKVTKVVFDYLAAWCDKNAPHLERPELLRVSPPAPGSSVWVGEVRIRHLRYDLQVLRTEMKSVCFDQTTLNAWFP